MCGGILRVGHQDSSVDDVGRLHHALALGDEGLPVVDARVAQVGHHHLALVGTVVGLQYHLVADVVDELVLVVHVGSHLQELRVGLPQVSHKQVVACSGTTLVEHHDGLLLVHSHAIEALGVGGVHIEQLVIALGRADAVVVNLVAFVHRRELLALHGVVGAVVESVALPCRAAEFRPHDMVVEGLARGGVEHIELQPVGPAARDAIGHVLAVVRKAHALQGHGAIVAQRVGVEEHPGRAAQLVHHVHHALVLQAVVLVEIPFAMFLERYARLLVVGHLAQPLKQFLALRDAVQKGIGHGILCLHPLGGLGTRVVLEPAVGVGHLGAEIFVYGIVAGCGGVVDALCRSRGAENRHGDDKNVACPHVFRIDELNEL